MNFDLLLFFVSSHPVEMAMALYVIGVVLLLDSMRAQSTTITELRTELTRSTTAHQDLRGEVHDLRERCADLLARQQRINTRAPDSSRIDTAVRLLKRGTGDTRTLQDLGLSHSEAKLLVRLHGIPAAPQVPAPELATQDVPPNVAVPRAAKQVAMPVATPAATPSVTRQRPRTVASQGQALANLLKA